MGENSQIDIGSIVRGALARVAPGLPEERLEALADSIISDLDLDGVINEAAEARNLDGIRGDLQRDSQVMFIDISGDGNTEALEQFLFGL